MATWHVANVLLVLSFTLIFQACITVEIGGGEPTSTPSIPRISIAPPLTKASLGPILVEGMYCWDEYSSADRFMRMAVFNPSDRPVRIQADPYGSFSSRSLELALTDSFLMSEDSACEYSLVIDRGYPGNEYLTQSYEVKFEGVMLPSPDEEALALVKVYLSHLDAGDIDSPRAYIEGDITPQRLADLVAWRESIRPLSTSVESCRPRFTFDPTEQDSFVAPTWDCKVRVVYSLSQGSGTWLVQVLGYVTDGSLKITTSN